MYLSTGRSKKCKYCGEPIANEKSEYYIEPEYGFKTGITKESSRMKPKRTYAGEVSYLGGGKIDLEHLEIGRSMIIETSTDDELLVLNRSRFYLCPVCGYSEIEKKKTNSPVYSIKHKNFRQYDCDNQELREIRIGHSFKTDVARITLPILQSVDGESYSRALSFLYAFLEGVSTAMEIERNDIDGIIELNLENESYDVLIYDNVPGGAGHVKRLVNKEAVIKSLHAALEKVSQNCCDEDTSCYNCLRNYYNQAYHSRLKRRYAKETLTTLLNDIRFL